MVHRMPDLILISQSLLMMETVAKSNGMAGNSELEWQEHLKLRQSLLFFLAVWKITFLVQDTDDDVRLARR